MRESSGRDVRVILVTSALIAVAVAAAGYEYYRYEEGVMRQAIQNDLSAIADLKVNLVANWRRERLSDASIIRDSQPIAYRIQEWLNRPGDQHLEREILRWAASLQEKGYRSVLLVDAKGKVRLCLAQGDRTEEYRRDSFEIALRTRRVYFSDLYRVGEAGPIRLDLYAPIVLLGPRVPTVIGVLVLRIDPYEFLYPFLQSWPSPSRSAETVVVRRDGDSVLFLNELRHRRGVELAFRLPLNRPGLPSALAVTGEPRIIEGVDYRGVPVLAAVRPLPDSPWFLVTKVDIEEIYAPIRERAWLTTLVASLLILTAGAVLGFWWKHRASAFYRQQLESQRERETLARQEAEVRSRLAAIVESSGDAIIGIAPDRRVTSWNPGAERLYGYQAEEVIGRPISFLVPEERRGEVYEVMNRVLLGEWAAGYETVRLRKDGSPVQVSVTVSPVKDNSGAIVGISTIARDITEQKRSEAERARLLELEKAARLEAEAASRMKDEFLATVSHELRTPLEPILGWAYSLLHDDLDAETTAEALESIERNARVQASLVEDLLDVSRFDAGKLRLDMTTLDVAAPVRAALDGVRTTAKAREIRLELVVENGPRRVRGDVNRLQQVMWNLLSNALKFTHDGGRIDVRVRSDGDCVEISVADTGQGIEPEFLPRVFDRFTQADSSPTRKQRGLGLGLTIVRQLVELHGGEVRAESRGAGQGATFTVRLPSLADVHAAELQ